MKLAVIDLGTNSVRFDIYDLSDELEPHTIYQDKQMIRLGDGVFLEQKLNGKALSRAYKAFDEIKGKIKEFEVDKVFAFATCALREASDRDEFIKEIKKKTNIDLRILSGDEEANLIAKGILNNEELPEGLYALVDIGGGSTEVSICHKRSLIKSFSFRLGANRLQQVFLKTQPPKPTEFIPDPIKALRDHIQHEINPVLLPKNENSPIKMVLGSSGTIRAYKKIIKQTGDSIEPYKKKSLSRLIKIMKDMDPQEILSIPGMDPKRADIILAGGILLEEILQTLQAKLVNTTDYNLRDGILEMELEIMAKSNFHFI